MRSYFFEAKRVIKRFVNYQIMLDNSPDNDLFDFVTVTRRNHIQEVIEIILEVLQVIRASNVLSNLLSDILFKMDCVDYAVGFVNSLLSL